MIRYYSTQRPIAPGTFPKKEQVVKIENFDKRIFCQEIGREAWGFIEYSLALTEEEANAYELVVAGKKFFYCVTTSINDKGKATSAITNTIESFSKPENNSKSLKYKDVYNDWFDSKEEAEEFVKESRR